MIKPECIEYKLLEWRKLPEFTFTVDTVKGSQMFSFVDTVKGSHMFSFVDTVKGSQMLSFVDTVKGSQMFSFAALQYNYHIMILTH